MNGASSIIVSPFIAFPSHILGSTWIMLVMSITTSGELLLEKEKAKNSYVDNYGSDNNP